MSENLEQRRDAAKRRLVAAQREYGQSLADGPGDDALLDKATKLAAEVEALEAAIAEVAQKNGADLQRKREASRLRLRVEAQRRQWQRRKDAVAVLEATEATVLPLLTRPVARLIKPLQAVEKSVRAGRWAAQIDYQRRVLADDRRELSRLEEELKGFTND